MDKIIWQQLTPDERNRLIAERIFDWQPVPCPANYGAMTWSEYGFQWKCGVCGAGSETFNGFVHGIVNPYPDYVGDLNETWKIVDKIIESHKFMSVKIEYAEGWKSETERWQAYLCMINPYDGEIVGDSADTPQEAIFLAALKAIGLDVQ